MKSEELLDTIGEASDEYIQDVRTAKIKKPVRWVKWSYAIAACLVLAMGVSLFLGGMGGNAGSGGDSDLHYIYYVGPVLPLTVQGDASGITAERNVDYDFSGYYTWQDSYEDSKGEMVSYDRYSSQAAVTDSYVLTNESGEDKTVTMLYPHIGDMREWEHYPTVTVDGAAVTTTMHPGPYSGGFEGAWGSNKEGTVNIKQLDCFEGYQVLLGSDVYQNAAFDAFPSLDQPVFVYRLHDYVYSQTTEDVNPTLCLSYHIDYGKTAVMSYGMNGASWNHETGDGYRSVSSIEYRPNVDPEFQYPDDAYVIVMGNDLESYNLQGYRDGGCDKGEELNDLSCTVTRYETTLGEIMDFLLEDYLGDMLRQMDSLTSGNVSAEQMPMKELYLGLSAELLYTYGMIGETPVERFDAGMLEDIFSGAMGYGRVIYFSFDVRIPAGESVAVEATMLKDASIDYIGEDKGKDGYDMATKLGSNLTFTQQTASICQYDQIEIVAQNFGFDLVGCITEVTLDLNQDHYWMEIRKLKTESGGD